MLINLTRNLIGKHIVLTQMCTFRTCLEYLLFCFTNLPEMFYQVLKKIPGYGSKYGGFRLSPLGMTLLLPSDGRIKQEIY